MTATGSGHSQHVIAEVADQLFAAIERGDETTLNELFDDEIAVWRDGARRDNDKERDGFVQQHILHATGRNGGSIALRVCIVIKLGVNTLISRIDEYFDPAELAPLMS
ncbi:nuclear transport factor 2 family protein [Mycobacterium sp.]|uniref:nuclear transport factor 2 family protein n=1 Tax=Mycobacterium sp. TaxID=1785 RepID=UPI003F959949